MRRKIVLYGLCLGLEIVVFCYWYIHGPRGLQAVHSLNQELAELHHKTDVLSKKISLLQEELVDWNHDSVYKEQYARRHLHMAGRDEQWYRY